MIRTSHRSGHRALPAAFTLIELLIVIAIIALLMALSAGVYFKVMGTQENNASSVIVTKVQNALWQQYANVKQKAESTSWEPLPPPADNANATTAYKYIVNNFVPSNNDPKLIRVLWVKFRLRQEFPMSFKEALDTTVFPSLYVNQLANAGVTTAPATPATYESSACLWMALQRNVSGGLRTEELGKGATKTFATSGGKITALVDAWGNPLAFCRWPTGYLDLNPNGNAQSGFNDPEDREGSLNNPTWMTSTGAKTFQTQYFGHALPARAKASVAPSSYKLRPIVLSPGPDKALGLDPYTFAPDSSGASANDNIASKATP